MSKISNVNNKDKLSVKVEAVCKNLMSVDQEVAANLIVELHKAYKEALNACDKFVKYDKSNDEDMLVFMVAYNEALQAAEKVVNNKSKVGMN